MKNLKPHLQMEFIELKHDCEAQIVFEKVGVKFAYSKKYGVKDTYPQLWKKCMLFYFTPSKFLAGKVFSVVVQLLTKQRNWLDICNKGYLRFDINQR